MSFLEKLKANAAAKKAAEEKEAVTKEAADKKMSPFERLKAKAAAKKAEEEPQSLQKRSEEIVKNIVEDKKSASEKEKEEEEKEKETPVDNVVEEIKEEPVKESEVKEESVKEPEENAEEAEEEKPAPKKRHRRTKEEIEAEKAAKEEKKSAKAEEKKAKAEAKIESEEPETEETELDTDLFPKKKNYKESAGAILDYFVDDEWRAREKELMEKMSNIRIERDMNVGTLKYVLADLSNLMDEFAGELYEQRQVLDILENKETGLIPTIKKTAADGANACERERKATEAILHAKIGDNNDLNLVEIANTAHTRYTFLDSLFRRIQMKQSLCITMASGLKMEEKLINSTI